MNRNNDDMPSMPSEPTVAFGYRPTPQDEAVHEAEVLRRELSLARALKAISAADRADAEFAKFIAAAEDEMEVAEEAIKLDKFAAAAVSLGNAEFALDELRKARFAREESIRKVNLLGKAALIALEKAEAKRRAREEAARHGKIQLWEDGPYWATTNIGAEKPEDYGFYFWWGDTVGYRRKGDAWVASDGSSRNFVFSEVNVLKSTRRRKVCSTPTRVLAPEHDAAHVHWGGGWRMPTKQELGDLGSKCDWTWTTVNGVKGHVVEGRGAYAGASIFLPAAGFGYRTSLCAAGSGGYYWSSVSYLDFYYSWRLYFNSGRHGTIDSDRFLGFPVRPVQGFAK